jgi:hypothetical protein
MCEKIIHSTSYSTTNHYFSGFRPLRTPVLVHDVHMSDICYLLHFIRGLFNNALAVFDW